MKIRAGEYGEEWKKLFEEHPDGAVNISSRVYYCSKCGGWHQDQCLDFYLPKKGTESKENAIPWSVAAPTGGLDEDTYLSVKTVAPWDLSTDYVLYKKFPHKCSSCGNTRLRTLDLDPNRSEKTTSLSGITLRCSECGGAIKKTKEVIFID